MVRRVAVAIRTGYPCDGVTVRQNNEPAGGQDVWHLHTHVIPRYIGDGTYLGVPVRADDRDRARYADRLRELPSGGDGWRNGVSCSRFSDDEILINY